jgi:hypothetical protein
MKLNLLVVTSAVVYAIPGLVFTFAPDEVLLRLGVVAGPPLLHWLLELLGGALLGMAIMNAMQRYAMVGGVYGRPLLVANLALLSIGGLSSLRLWRSTGDQRVLIAAIVSCALLAAYGRLLFKSPET